MTDLSGASINLGAPVPLVSDGAYHAGEPVFLRLIDPDQNLDPLVRETVEVLISTDGGDRETLLISENGPSTGVFIGYIMSATPPPIPGDCRISVGVGESIRAEYLDPADGADSSVDISLIDPFGLIFDSTTGQPVDGASVTLWDVLLGSPATVIGDDGLSSFPATILSGGVTTDSGGTFYDFGPGQFRFPFVMQGQYELRIAPPTQYSHPSIAPDSSIQALPGAPYSLVLGSRGEPFVVPVGPAVRVDIPLDPLSSGLLVTKQAGKERVSAGEFVSYRIRVTNASAVALNGASLVDRLPPRFRFEPGSAERDGVSIADPVLSRGGNEFRFDLDDLAANTPAEIQYVVRVVSGARPGEYVNRAFVELAGGGLSNFAEAIVEVMPDLFDDRAYLLGRIHVDGCDGSLTAPAEGLGGVRIYLEDGSFVVTDGEGRFHFEAISSGLHVVQVDLDTVPDEFEVFECGNNSRRAGRAFSEFVEVEPGSLWRTDFHVRRKTPETGILVQRLSAEIERDWVNFNLSLSSDRVEAQGVVAMIGLPAGLELDTSSVFVEEILVEANVESGMFVLRLGSMAINGTKAIAFRTKILGLEGEIAEVKSVIRARSPDGRVSTTEPATLRISIPTAELLRHGEPLPDEESNPGQNEIAVPAESSVLEHRLLQVKRGRWEYYVLQIFVDDTLPEVILAEVDLPANQQFLGWTAHDERGDLVTTTRIGQKIRFVLPRSTSQKAVRVFLTNGVPRRVLQVFFTTDHMFSGEGVARSRIVPPSADLPAAPMPQALNARDLEPQKIGSSKSRFASHSESRNRKMEGADASITSSDGRAPQETGLKAARSQYSATSQVDISLVDHAVTESAKRTHEKNQVLPSEESKRAIVIRPEERFGSEWLEQVESGLEFVYPKVGALPRIPSLKIGIQHDPNIRVELLRNGALVSSLHFDGRSQNAAKTVVLSRWRGVGLDEGKNSFVAVFRDAEGNEIGRKTRRVHYSGSPVRAELLVDESHLIADGRTTPVIALRLTDRWGEPVREGSTGFFDLEWPYQTAEQVEAEQSRPLAGLGFERPSFVVDKDGIARIRLYPTSVVGEARLRFQFREGSEYEVEAWLEPGDRDWVLVGLASSTVGWNSNSGNQSSRHADDVEAGVLTEGRVAFFAKGRVPGDFLLTAAYDSDASTTRLRDRLFQSLEPDEHYTLYGDRTQRDFDAPTSGSLYVKIERKRFFALYGDYQTGLEDTELSRYSRTLTGAKVEYKGRRYDVKAFVADSDQSFVKDEIRGDGTSGLYRLSREEVIPGSESIVLETRDRFRPELVVSSEPMSRFSDYEIDYEEGTLFFRRPILGQDSNFDPVFIVVNYETKDRGSKSISGGGRIAARAVEGRLEVGMTAVHEGTGEINSQIFGSDFTFNLTDETELRAEFAHSRGDDFDGHRSGEAWLVHLDHRSENLDLRAYAKEQGRGFGIGQLSGISSDLRSYGIDGNYEWSKALNFESSVFREENLSTGSKRHVAELFTRWEEGQYGLRGGVRYSGDEIDGEAGHGVQLLGGGRVDFLDGLLSIRADGEAAVVEDGFGSYPHRATIGADLKLHERLSFFADEELTFGNQQRTSDTRLGFRGAPWKGASVTTSVAQEQREFGPRTYANLGLQQRWDATPQWGFDLAIDRTATIRDSGNPAFAQGAPSASGSFDDDYTAISLGTAYRRDGWSGTGRVEARFGEKEDRWGFVAGLLRDENSDLSWSARVDLFYSNARSGSKELRTNTSLSLAYRPLRSH